MRGVFVENHDSFSWNVIELLPVDREHLRVVTAAEAPAALEGADFLVLGPGPMDPARAGLLELVRRAADLRLPTLGVCLGHQALGLAFGATLVRSRPAHGEVALARFRPSRLLGALDAELEVMRYHSLSLSEVPSPLSVVAELHDGTVMAVEHQTLPMLGLQFHPDSYASPRGRELVQRFFERAVAPRLGGRLLEAGTGATVHPGRSRGASPTSGPGFEGIGVVSQRTPDSARSERSRRLESVTSAAPPGVPQVALSTLATARDFVLLAPEYSASGDWTLFTEVREGRGELLLCEAEGRAPRWFTGERRRVTLLNDVPPVTCTPRLEITAHAAAIETIRAAIAAGDVYQVNLTQRVSLGVSTGAQLLATLCRRAVPRFAAWFNVASVGEFVTGSPELLLELDGQRLRSEPMKGTAGAAGRAHLEASAKDRAELAMITDLVRDDLHRVCEAGSVHVTTARRFLELPYAIQTVSDVEGRLPPGLAAGGLARAVGPDGGVEAQRDPAPQAETSLDRALRQLHPGGSVTGAPRQAALELIAALETSPRGFYCGTLGLTTGPLTRAALLIRTASRVAGSGEFLYGVGGGITFASNPAEELAELDVKLGALRGAP